ncbi:MAG: ABC transporter ATP-binding protein [Chitinophagales bacterium]|nr:ABC transporter ATP-binding protein [Chitinophagales bacterium]
MSNNHLEPAIEISHLTKYVKISDTDKDNIWKNIFGFFYKREKSLFYILKDINLSVPKLSTLGIIGENGSGKSSLLKLISNISSPSNGYIKNTGRVAAILDIGSGFQSELTGRENIEFYGKIIGMEMSEIKEQTETIIQFSELSDYIDRQVKYYSNGMYLRLAFSIAVHSSAEIILFDEVLAVGDASFNVKCFQKINQIRKEKTIVLVSHNMDDITRACDQCVWLEKGQMRAFGDTHEVVQKYILNTLSKDDKLMSYFDNKETFLFTPFKYKDQFILRDFYLYNKKGLRTKIVDYSDDFIIKFDIEVLSELTTFLIPTIQLIDKSNNNLIFSSSVYQGKPYQVIDNKGVYEVECVFPKKLINKGIYRIHLYLYDSERILYFTCENAGIFKVQELNEDINYFISKTSFSLTPSMDWSIHKRDSLTQNSKKNEYH